MRNGECKKCGHAKVYHVDVTAKRLYEGEMREAPDVPVCIVRGCSCARYEKKKMEGVTRV